ncbi:MAG: alcohol dehydrogenase [bacterium]|nr:MAG: alcohol dehydrogenase [bacterium]
MKAVAVNPAKKTLDLIDAPPPEIGGKTEVRLKILETGICGTDREICQFDYGTPPDGSDYLILGHESLGEVVETGSAVKGFKVGDLAVPTVRRVCPGCVSCDNDESDMCFTGNFKERGIGGLHGYMSEMVVEDESNMVNIPHELRPSAVLLEPLSITMKALAQIDSIQRRMQWKGRRALVFGAGPIGTLAALAFVNRGYKTWIYSRIHENGMAKPLMEQVGVGMISSFDYDVDGLLSGFGEFDIILEATGASQTAFEMIKTLALNGIYVFTGIPGKQQLFSFNGTEAMRSIVLKNQILVGTVNSNLSAFEDGKANLLDFENKFPGVTPNLITQRVSYDEVIPHLLERKKGEIKTILSW